MEEFNDWQLMNEESQHMAKKEYSNFTKSHIFSTTTPKYIPQLFEKIAYLKQLLKELKKHNRNEDIIYVLNDIQIDIDKQTEILKKNFDMQTNAFGIDKVETKIFCNNLKLSIQTVLEIIDLLANEQSILFQNENLSIIQSFLQICKKYVSLFGDCQYRLFVQKYGK